MQTNDSVSAWRRAGRLAGRSLRRHPGTLPSVVLCTGMIFLAGTVLLSAAVAVQVRHYLLTESQVSLAVQSQAADADVQSFYAALQALPGVRAVRFLPKEQALAEQRLTRPELAQFLDRYQLQNPFPDLFILELEGGTGLVSLRTLLNESQWSSLLAGSALSDLLRQEETLLRVENVALTAKRTATAGSVLAGILLLLLFADIAWTRLRERAADRATVLLLGGGFAESDGAVLLELLCLVFLSTLIATAGILTLVYAAPALLPAFSGDAVLTYFINGVRDAVWSGAPKAAVFILFAMPVIALCSIGLARLRSGFAYGSRS